MLPLIFFAPIFARETCIDCDMFFSPTLMHKRNMIAEYVKQGQSSEDLGS